MKTNKFLFRFLSVAVFSALSLVSSAQDYETSKIIEKSGQIDQDASIELSNYSADLEIITTNNSEIKIRTEVIVSAKDKEDADKLIQAVENFDFKASGHLARINTHFYQNMKSVNGRTTMTLKNGEKIKLKNYKISHKVEIPATVNLDLRNRYSEMQLGTLKGKAQFGLYNCDVTAESFSESVKINAKYSKIRANDFGAGLNLDFYNSTLNFKTAQNIEGVFKYSKLQGESAGKLTLNSYNDKFHVETMTDLKFTAKYSEVVSSAKVNNCSLNLYDSNITIGGADEVDFSGKYCTLKLGEVGNCNISSSYDNSISTTKVNNLSIPTSKYSKYTMEEIGELRLTGYNDKVQIKNITSEFQKISVDGKYVRLDVSAKSEPVRLECRMRYGKVSYPDNFEIKKHIDKDNMLEVIGGTGEGLIKVTGYDNLVVLQ